MLPISPTINRETDMEPSTHPSRRPPTATQLFISVIIHKSLESYSLARNWRLEGKRPARSPLREMDQLHITHLHVIWELLRE